MNIDLHPLHHHFQDKISISGEYLIEPSYYENSEVLSIDPVIVDGDICQKENEDGHLEDYIQCTVKGVLYLSDSISLEKIKYPFLIKIDDFIEENAYFNQNVLDIFEFLWENILLEVPLHYTEVEDFKDFQGDGWKLIHEDEIEGNQPFRDLLKDFEKE